jgi:hypothetical protein
MCCLGDLGAAVLGDLGAAVLGDLGAAFKDRGAPRLGLAPRGLPPGPPLGTACPQTPPVPERFA